MTDGFPGQAEAEERMYDWWDVHDENPSWFLVKLLRDHATWDMVDEVNPNREYMWTAESYPEEMTAKEAAKDCLDDPGRGEWIPENTSRLIPLCDDPDAVWAGMVERFD